MYLRLVHFAKENWFATFLILNLFPVSVYGQQTQYSALYYNNGKLRTDTTLSISPEQFKVWRKAEQNIIATITTNLNYPSIATRNGIEGSVIVAFECSVKEIKLIRTLKALTSSLDKEAILAVEKSAREIYNELVNNSPGNFKATGTYYVTIDFGLINFDREVKNRSAIPVLKVTAPIRLNRNLEEPLIKE